MPKKKAHAEKVHEQPQPFWSGLITFGLVSIPVALFPATHGKPFSLKMIDRDGALLTRRFFCEWDKKELKEDEIIRGYQLEPHHYVIVDDEELEALAPKKSREIDLKRFVAIDDVDPVYFERAYFLVPDGGTAKAYRLLAKSMEEKQRAGIATFVMRGKEYLVAIISEHGILRAETLRFHDELRSPEYVGLPKLEHGDKKGIEKMVKAMHKTEAKKMNREQLIDDYQRRVMDHIEKKLKSGKDVIPAPEEIAEEQGESNIIDLMQVLKERLQSRRPKAKKSEKDNLKTSSKSELYELAQELHIPGRSKMSKQQLIKVLAQHRRTHS